MPMRETTKDHDAPAPDAASGGEHASSSEPASAVQRAEALLDRLGDATRRRVESVVPDSPAGGAADAKKNGARTAAPADPSAAVDHAEVLLDEMGQRIGALATVVGKRVRKVAARAWEELEDIYAEAEDLRAHNRSQVTGVKASAVSSSRSADGAAGEGEPEDITSA